MAGELLDFTVTFGGKKFTNALRGMSEVGKFVESGIERTSPIFRREMLLFLRAVASNMQSRHGQPWVPGRKMPAGNKEGRLQVRSGKGLRELKGSIKVVGGLKNPGTMVGTISASFPFSVHEAGKARITPKKSKFLTIPLPAALDGRGLPLRPKARDFTNTFVARSRKGNLIIFQRTAGGLVPLFLLKPVVKLPRRLGLQSTINAGLPFFLNKSVDMAVEAFTAGLKA